MIETSYVIAISFHDQRPSAISACSTSSSLHSHVTIDIDNFIIQHQWVGFALKGSNKGDIIITEPSKLVQNYYNGSKNFWMPRYPKQ